MSTLGLATVAAVMRATTIHARPDFWSLSFSFLLSLFVSLFLSLLLSPLSFPVALFLSLSLLRRPGVTMNRPALARLWW